MIHKVDVPPVRCEVGLRLSKSMNEVDSQSLSSLILMFQHSHHVSIELRPRCSFLRIQPSLRSVAYRCHRQWGPDKHLVFGDIIYRLYNVGDRTKSWRTPAYISLGVDILPSTDTANFRSDRKELIGLNKLVENFNFYNLYNKPGCQVAMLYQRLFQYPRIVQP
jgi:hypothetical protein